MDRLTSTSTSASTHKRAASKPANNAPPSNSTAVVTFFLRNCRLLNFDLLPDWPAATPTSFGNQDARARIRCTEWCLYQLFRVYDSSTTLDKLQPFFPPLEPLQSINLRAALFRCLNDLKKNGVLGRETVLRKSMLDDCQGDKFWELCLAFSTIVLRKVTRSNKDRLPYEKPLAEKIGTAKAITKAQRESMLPLAIAHRVALSKVLLEKEKKRDTFARLHHVLADKDADLRVRKVQVQDRPKSKRPRSADGRIAQDVLEKKWIGSDDVRNALQNGDEAAGADALLMKPFNVLWEDNNRNRLFHRDTVEIGLLEDLEHRTSQQKRRLQQWQSFYQKLLDSKPAATKEAEKAAQKPAVQFDQHHNMTLRDISNNRQQPRSAMKHSRNVNAAKYDEILTAMREELRKRSANDPGSPTKPVARVKRPSFNRQSISVDVMTRTSPETHQRSISQTTVPVRNMFGKRVSSKSRSYQAPKVVGQREHIPLKSEIFSPLKQDRANSTSGSPRGSMMLASPLEESPIETMNSAGSELSRQSSITNDHSPTSAQPSSATPSRASSGSSSTRLVSRLSLSEQSDSANDLPSSKQFLITRTLDGMGRTVRPSLADRTRMSMAYKSTDDIITTTEADAITTNQASPVRSDTPVSSNEQSCPFPTLPEQRPSLQDRTRQSISLAPQLSPPKKLPSHTRSQTSQIYPVNQFETPEKRQPRRSTVTLDMDAAAGATREKSLTPRDKLFEEDADMTSIFKTRPKLARSPTLSPFVGGDDSVQDIMDGDGDVSFAEDDDVAMSSPLRTR